MTSIFNNDSFLTQFEPLSTQIAFRATKTERDLIEKHCKKIKVKKSDLLRHALKQYFTNLQNQKAHEQTAQQETAQ